MKYISALSNTFETINKETYIFFSDSLKENIVNKKKIFTCGNGGSASISNHFVCDFNKRITKFRPRFISLSSNIEIISAISNDISYEDVFVKQVENLFDEGDCILCISSSGNSENVIRAAEFIKKNNGKVFSLTGFDGGDLKKISDFNIHIDSKIYGIVEDCHQVIMHSLINEFLNEV